MSNETCVEVTEAVVEKYVDYVAIAKSITDEFPFVTFNPEVVATGIDMVSLDSIKAIVDELVHNPYTQKVFVKQVRPGSPKNFNCRVEIWKVLDGFKELQARVYYANGSDIQYRFPEKPAAPKHVKLQ